MERTEKTAEIPYRQDPRVVQYTLDVREIIEYVRAYLRGEEIVEEIVDTPNGKVAVRKYVQQYFEVARDNKGDIIYEDKIVTDINGNPVIIGYNDNGEPIYKIAKVPKKIPKRRANNAFVALVSEKIHSHVNKITLWGFITRDEAMRIAKSVGKSLVFDMATRHGEFEIDWSERWDILSNIVNFIYLGLTQAIGGLTRKSHTTMVKTEEKTVSETGKGGKISNILGV